MNEFRVWDKLTKQYNITDLFMISPKGVLFIKGKNGYRSVGVDQIRYEVEFAVGIDYQGQVLFDGDVVETTQGWLGWIEWDEIGVRYILTDGERILGVSDLLRNRKIVGTKHDKKYRELCK